jgi:hypothetical protein
LVKSAVFSPTPWQQLHAAAGASRLDDRGLDLSALAELLSDSRREGEHCGRTDDLNLVARGGITSRRGERKRRGRRRKEEFLHVACSCSEKWSLGAIPSAPAEAIAPDYYSHMTV